MIRNKKKLSEQSSELCQKCNEFAGTPYTFYYGKQLSEIRLPTEQFYKQKIEWRYEIGGSQQALICKKCVLKHKMKMTFWGLLVSFFSAVLAILISILSDASGSGLFWGIILGGFSVLGIIVSVMNLAGSGKSEGEQLAISVRRIELEIRGFDQFWTTEEYENLKAKKKP